MHQVNIEDVPRGEFFRRKPDARKTYTRGDYCRFERKYIGDDWDDISRCIYLKKGAQVWVGFDF